MADLWEIGTAGIVEEPDGWRVFFDDSADIDPLLRHYRRIAVEIRREQSRDWQLISREGWDPVLAGERFFIVPPWLNDAAPPGRIRLVIDTGMAFGSGRHESTQLMIEALETYLMPAQSVLDVGCGSGILSAVCEALGAGCALACDVDFESVKRAPLHTRAPAFVGSATAVQSASFDFVAVNISAEAIDSLAADLHRVAKPGGILLLAGFIEQNPPKHFQAERVWQRNEWQCWACRADAAYQLNR